MLRLLDTWNGSSWEKFSRKCKRLQKSRYHRLKNTNHLVHADDKQLKGSLTNYLFPYDTLLQTNMEESSSVKRKAVFLRHPLRWVSLDPKNNLEIKKNRRGSPCLSLENWTTQGHFKYFDAVLNGTKTCCLEIKKPKPQNPKFICLWSFIQKW